MRELEVNFPGKEFHDALFQAVPVPIVVVDKELEVWDYNAAAARSIQDRKDNKPNLLGQALRCVHAYETETGCGQGSRCADCTILWAVQAASQGQSVLRKWARVDVEGKGKAVKMNLQVSSAPVFCGKYSLVLLMLEGLGE